LPVTFIINFFNYQANQHRKLLVINTSVTFLLCAFPTMQEIFSCGFMCIEAFAQFLRQMQFQVF